MPILPVIVVLIIVIVIAIIGFLIYSNRRKTIARAKAVQQHMEELRERQQRALPASATVVSLRNKPAIYEGLTEVRINLRLTIKMPDTESYTATTSWYVTVTSLDQLQPGAILSVKVDRTDRQLIFPNVSWARMHPEN